MAILALQICNRSSILSLFSTGLNRILRWKEFWIFKFVKGNLLSINSMGWEMKVTYKRMKRSRVQILVSRTGERLSFSRGKKWRFQKKNLEYFYL